MAQSIKSDTRNLRMRMKNLAREFDEKFFLQIIGQRQLRFVDEIFRSEGAAGGSPWKPLSPNTIAARRQGPGTGDAKILRDTGRLAQSFTQKLRPHEVEIGSEDPRAEWHQFGTPPYTIEPNKAKMLRFMTANGVRFAGRVHHPGLPARPMLPPEELAEKVTVDVLTATLNRLVAQNGPR